MNRTDTINDQLAEWAELEERATHGDTMKSLSPLEAELLESYRQHFGPTFDGLTN